MKIHFKQNHGSIFLVVLIITGLIGFTLASYLHLVSNQNVSIIRSMAWNQAVAVSEAGIEEAMAHLNLNRTNRTRDGWKLEGAHVVKERIIGEQKYKTYISAFAEPPAITSQGFVRNPATGEFLPDPRTISVSTTNDALFAKGLVARETIDLNGNNIRTDSFDSSTNTLSTAGRYDSAKFNDRGDIATNAKVINVGNADIFGRASTGPGGNVNIGANGVVGSKAWHAAGNKGPQPGWTTDDMNVQFPEVVPPTGGGVSLPLAITPALAYPDGNSYSYILSPVSYKSTSGLNLHNKKMLIQGPGLTTIYVAAGNISISGQGAIVIATNAMLHIYMAGTTADLGGKSVINNSGQAEHFAYWGLPSNTDISMGGNAEFTGTIYAPDASLVLNGGGSTDTDFMGASVTRTVKMNGHFKFHYDEALGRFAYKRGYTIISWNEVASIL